MKEITEYQKSAALMAGDIESMFELAEARPEQALEIFKRLKEMRDIIISDDKIRDSRYSAMVSIFAAGQAGLIRVTEV